MAYFRYSSLLCTLRKTRLILIRVDEWIAGKIILIFLNIKIIFKVLIVSTEFIFLIQLQSSSIIQKINLSRAEEYQ